MGEKFAEQMAEIKRVCNALGLDYKQLAHRAAIKEETMRKYARGYQKIPDAYLRSIHNVEQAVKLTPKPFKVSRSTRPSIMHDPSTNIELRLVPVVSWGAAGKANDYEDLAEQIEETIECETKDPSAFALIVEGDSMEKEIMAGDRIVFSPASEPRNNDIVVARLKDGGVMVKRYRSKGPDNIQLESNREEYPLIEVSRASVRFIYPAIEIHRRLRR